MFFYAFFTPLLRSLLFYAFLVLHFFNKIFFFYILKKMSNESNQNVSNENLNPNNPSNNPPNNPPNNPSNNPNEKKRRGGSQKKRWVWEWFEADATGGTCEVEGMTGGELGKYIKYTNSRDIIIGNLNN